MKIKVAVPDTPEWDCAVALIRKKYSESFAADASPNPDRFFVCFADEAGSSEMRASACVGISFGARRPKLFSEQYLDAPIEQVIAEREERPVSRETLIEVGSLAATGFRAATELVRVLPVLAWCMGTEHVVTTATARVRAICEKTGIYFLPLCLADPARLDEAAQKKWGTYYQEQPITSYISMQELSRTFFADNTGRYDLGGIALDVQNMELRKRRSVNEVARPRRLDAATVAVEQLASSSMTRSSEGLGHEDMGKLGVGQILDASKLSLVAAPVIA